MVFCLNLSICNNLKGFLIPLFQIMFASFTRSSMASNRPIVHGFSNSVHGFSVMGLWHLKAILPYLFSTEVLFISMYSSTLTTWSLPLLNPMPLTLCCNPLALIFQSLTSADCPEIDYSTTGVLLSQCKYTMDLLQRSKMLHTNPISSPMSASLKLSKFDSPNFEDATLFCNIVGGLQYFSLSHIPTSPLLWTKFASSYITWSYLIGLLSNGSYGISSLPLTLVYFLPPNQGSLFKPTQMPTGLDALTTVAPPVASVLFLVVISFHGVLANKELWPPRVQKLSTGL